jgi:hypothetical protein
MTARKIFVFLVRFESCKPAIPAKPENQNIKAKNNNNDDKIDPKKPNSVYNHCNIDSYPFRVQECVTYSLNILS